MGVYIMAGWGKLGAERWGRGMFSRKGIVGGEDGLYVTHILTVRMLLAMVNALLVAFHSVQRI